MCSHLDVREAEDLDAAGQPLGHQLTVHGLHDHHRLHRVLLLRHAAQDQPHLVGYVADHRGDGGWETHKTTEGKGALTLGKVALCPPPPPPLCGWPVLTPSDLKWDGVRLPLVHIGCVSVCVRVSAH